MINPADADPADGWRQLNLTCPDRYTAEQAAITGLRPLLIGAQDAGAIAGWWFVRKAPTWRIRLRAASPQFLDHARRVLTDPSNGRTATVGIYEPETHAFGGPAGMELAHQLFQVDSRCVLDRLDVDPNAYRRELAVILAGRLLRAARLDLHEQGDCWARLAGHRSATPAPQPTSETIAAVHQLLTSDDAEGSPLQAVPGWTTAMQDAGRGLADLAAAGQLTRGLRAVLTHHLVFLFNRHGISGPDQHQIAAAAQRAAFGPHPEATTLPAVTGAATDEDHDDHERDHDDHDDAVQLRHQLADYIDSWGVFTTPQVQAAFRTVPRHLFLPGVDLETAYGRNPVVTQRAADGTSLSSASSPSLVATMLEQLDTRPGHRILEVGAATGINAALLAELTGPTGTVVTIEFDAGLAAGAAENLHRAGYEHVIVLPGDGALGHPVLAPYDRIIVTAEAWDLPPAWWDQLTPGGRIVVPLRLHGSGLTRALAFNRAAADRMTSVSAAVCGFVPMRGQAAHDEDHLQLADDIVFKIDADDLHDLDRGTLSRVLTQPRQEHWTGIRVRHDEPAEHLDLWLLTATTDRFGRLSVSRTARGRGAADPAPRWAGAAVYTPTTLAYLATRDLDDQTMELGLITHTPRATELTARTVDLLHRWSRERPGQPSITAHRRMPGTDDDGYAPTAMRIRRPNTTLTIGW